LDVLRIPALGSFLTWQHARLTLQLVLLVVAVIVVAHGLLGPQLAPRNLATVLTSIHWRGLLVVALLAVGNMFCTACPMILARDTARRAVHPGLRWPRRLRGKWLGLILFAAVLLVYELFDLWELPRATAWLVVGYFIAALAIDIVFKGASFCKYICPIGQFNFIASVMSPTELQVRDIGTCHSCRTTDCIKGRYAPTAPHRLVQRGCELALFLPLKVGNLDCTMCLDCVRACPHDNIGLVTRVPGAELLDTRRRSGVGRLAARRDIAALAVLFTFAALLNALAMTAAGSAIERALMRTMGWRSEAPALATVFVVGLVLLPVGLVGAAAGTTRLIARGEDSPLLQTALQFSYTLVPLGFGVWLAHYGFHLLTGALTIVPVTQSAAIDLLGYAALGEPLWRLTGMQPGAVFPIQLGCLFLGTAGSLALVRGTAVRDHPLRPGYISAPWIALILLVAAAAVWILAQPMDMRGVGFVG
jgi:polyferredoxin